MNVLYIVVFHNRYIKYFTILACNISIVSKPCGMKINQYCAIKVVFYMDYNMQRWSWNALVDFLMYVIN